MVAPVISRSATVLGGVTETEAGITAQTDSNGAYLYMQVSADPEFNSVLSESSPSERGVLTGDNNYRALARVSGLQPGRKYYWRIKAADSAETGVSYGDGRRQTGSFKTFEPKCKTRWSMIMVGCFHSHEYGEPGKRAASANIFGNMTALKADMLGVFDDAIYHDRGVGNRRNWVDDVTSGYQPQAYYSFVNPPVNDSTLVRARTHFMTAFDGTLYNDDGSALSGFSDCMGNLMAEHACMFQWGDHCAGYDGFRAAWDTSDADEQSRRDICHQAGHEYMHDTMRTYAENSSLAEAKAGYDWQTDTRSNTVTPVAFYHVDRHPVRIIVLDAWKLSDSEGDADTASKSQLGANTGSGIDQLQWAKNRIDDNPNPFLVVVLVVNGDGDHTYHDPPTTEQNSWKSYSYEFQELYEHIQVNGDPSRTIFWSGDAHSGGAMKHRRGIPINEYWTANLRVEEAAHLYITGFSSNPVDIAKGYPPAAVGYGAQPSFMHIGKQNCTLMECTASSVTFSIIELQKNTNFGGDRTNGPKVIWKRVFK